VTLNSVYVIPGYTFFYWGFTVPKKENVAYARFFKLKRGKQTRPITLIIQGKRRSAKIRLARQISKKYPRRNVIQIFYEREHETLKAFRKLFIYSYASTINKTKPLLKEILEFEHIRDGEFKVNVIAKQKTDFDNMFQFMEDKNLFAYWKGKGKEKDNLFINYSRHWHNVSELPRFENQVNVIYMLYHSRKKQLYVGKANQLGERVRRGEGRIGLDSDWDKFMFFEISPRYAPFIEQIEAFTIRTFAALLKNSVGVNPLNERNIKLVNRQLISK